MNNTQGKPMKRVLIAAALAVLASFGASFAQTAVQVQTSNPAAEGGAVAGATTGAIGGAIVGGPVGAVVGGIAGAATGAIAGEVAAPSASVREYVVTNRVAPVRMERQVTVGTVIPETVAVSRIPDYEYGYVYVNDAPVLVDPQTRQVVHIVQ
jgi:hypothetical protein